MGNNIRSSSRPKALAPSIPMPPLADAMDAVHLSVDRFCLLAGVEALAEMMEEDATTVCGARHLRHGDRRGYRWGRTHSEIGYHGGKVKVARPRVRDRAGKEVSLESWQALRDGNLLLEWALSRGASTKVACVKQLAIRRISPRPRSSRPNSSPPASDVMIPPSNPATTLCRSTGSNSNNVGLHSVCIVASPELRYPQLPEAARAPTPRPGTRPALGPLTTSSALSIMGDIRPVPAEQSRPSGASKMTDCARTCPRPARDAAHKCRQGRSAS